MQKLNFDTGLVAYQVNDAGVLRFNPSDPNLYQRFFDARQQMLEIEEELASKADQLPEDSGEAALTLLYEADKRIKNELNRVFGEPNDFFALLEGVNLMAVGENGERVVTNLFAMLTPILEEGAARCTQQKADTAVQKAQANRAARRAAAKAAPQ